MRDNWFHWLGMFTHKVITSHVSTKSGIVHSVQKKKVGLQGRRKVFCLGGANEIKLARAKKMGVRARSIRV